MKDDYYILLTYSEHMELVDSSIDISMQAIYYIKKITPTYKAIDAYLHTHLNSSFVFQETGPLMPIKYLKLRSDDNLTEHDNTNEKCFYIRELPDEYFLVYTNIIIINDDPKTSIIGSSNCLHYANGLKISLLKQTYKCDQLDGVKELLEDLKVI